MIPYNSDIILLILMQFDFLLRNHVLVYSVIYAMFCLLLNGFRLVCIVLIFTNRLVIPYAIYLPVQGESERSTTDKSLI